MLVIYPQHQRLWCSDEQVTSAPLFPISFELVITSSKVYTKGFSLRRRAIKLSLDPLLGYQREERLNFLNRQRHCYFVVDAKMCVCLNRSCVRSFAGCADLNLAGRAVEEGLVSQVQ